MPWQQHAADVALEIDPETGELWYEEVIVTVPRQSGKTTLILAILVWRCIVMALRLGPQTCTYIAQSGKMARRKLEREFARILRTAKSLNEVLPLSKQRPSAPDEWKLSMNNGSEHILFGTQSYLQIEAPTDKGSHGDVLDMPVIDEAFSREDDLVEQATDAATVTRRSPQSWVISTAGNERSIYLARKVIAGRKAIHDANSRTCYLEWSVPDDEAYDDPDVWAKYLPALGHTITVARLLARLDKAQRNPDEVDEDGFEPGIAGFRRGYLNQWPRFPQFGGAAVKSEISADEWADLEDDATEIVGPVVLGVGVAHDALSAAIVAVGRNAAGLAHVETIERGERTWWLEKRLRELAEKWSPVAVAWDNGGPARMVAPEIERAAVLGLQPAERMPLNGREWAAACEAFRQWVSDSKIQHRGDVHLTHAVSGADRQPVGDGWRWNVREARTDIAPLLAATAALRALETLPDAEQPLVPVFITT